MSFAYATGLNFSPGSIYTFLGFKTEGGDEIFDGRVDELTPSETWIGRGQLFVSAERADSAAEAVDGVGYIFGGMWDDVYVDQTNEYTPPDTMAAGGAMVSARRAMASFVISSTIYSVGGEDSTPTILGNVDSYNGTTWSATPTDIGTATMKASGFSLSAKGFLVAGVSTGGTQLKTSYQFDGSTWTAENDIPAVRDDGAAEASAAHGYYFGGYLSVNSQNDTYRFTDGAPGTWAADTDIRVYARARQTATLMNEKIYLIWGKKSRFHDTNEVDIFTPASGTNGTWAAGPSYNNPVYRRSQHSACRI